MQKFVDVARTGLDSVVQYPLRSGVTVACVLIALLPYLTGTAISHGLRRDAEVSLDAGADLYVSGERFGRPVGISPDVAKQIETIDGVERVTPRIVGGVVLGADRVHAVIVGLPAKTMPTEVDSIQGRLFAAGRRGELVMGSGLARRLKLQPGDRIPPFYRSRRGERVTHVVGVFKADVTLWQSRVIFTSLETAAEIFDQSSHVTGLLVDCRRGYEASVRRQIVRTLADASLGEDVRPRVVGRSQLLASLPRGILHREGVFNLHFLLAFVAAMLAILVTSGIGQSERRREVGILKALGWQTDEVLLRSLVESLLLSLLSASLAVVLSYVWLRCFNGYWVAGVFLADVGAFPEIPIPFQLSAVPVLLAFLFSAVVVMTGSLYATWRAAVASPREVMR